MPALKNLLPELLSLAVEWAQSESQRAVSTGRGLDPAEQALARAVGVRSPEQVRVAGFTRLNWPTNPRLRQAAMQTGLLGTGTTGLTLGYAVLLKEGEYSVRLLAHECRHVYQYEAYGSISAFLMEYLTQIVEVGYAHAPLEIDARKHESVEV